MEENAIALGWLRENLKEVQQLQDKMWNVVNNLFNKKYDEIGGSDQGDTWDAELNIESLPEGRGILPMYLA